MSQICFEVCKYFDKSTVKFSRFYCNFIIDMDLLGGWKIEHVNPDKLASDWLHYKPADLDLHCFQKKV